MSEQKDSTNREKWGKRVIPLLLLAIAGVALSLIGLVLTRDDIVLIGLCIILGLDVKFIDQLIDDASMERYRFLVFPLALLIPLLMGYLAIIHDPVFGMVMGTAIGLLLSGKLDHPVFIMAAIGFVIAMIAFVLLFSIDIAITSIYIIPLAAFGAFGDEYGHEYVSGRERNSSLTFFFDHRFLLKTVALICVVIGFAELIHFIGFLVWDISYDVVAVSWVDEVEAHEKTANEENGIERTASRKNGTKKTANDCNGTEKSVIDENRTEKTANDCIGTEKTASGENGTKKTANDGNKIKMTEVGKK